MGKAGTLSVDDFNSLKGFVSSYGAATLALKVAKACSKKAEMLVHEYPRSAVAAAYKATAKTISDALPNVRSSSVSGSTFTSLGQMVGRYGPELVVQKIAKIAKKSSSSDAPSLARIFPAA